MLGIKDVVDNRTICDLFGVANMGGIRVNKSRNLIVLISNNTDLTYRNEWKEGYPRRIRAARPLRRKKPLRTPARPSPPVVMMPAEVNRPAPQSVLWRIALSCEKVRKEYRG